MDDVFNVRETLDSYYHVEADATEIPEHGEGSAKSATLKDAKDTARQLHEWDGRARIVFRGEKVYLRIPENPNHEEPNFQVMPNLSDEEYQALKESIAERGLDYPIIVARGTGAIVDGHHRERAIKELETEGREIPDTRGYGSGKKRYEFITATVEEARELAWKLNMQRRHLNAAQKRELIRAKLQESPEWADRRIAKLLGVSPTTVGTVRKELEGTVQNGQLDKRVGADGKKRTNKSRRPAPEPAAVQEETDPEAIPTDVADAYYPDAVDGVAGEPDAFWASLTDAERELHDRLVNDETVVVNMSKSGPHQNLLPWLKDTSRLVKVDRTTDWGNPFETPGDGPRDTVIHNYEHHYWPYKPSLHARLGELRGKALGCWCAPQACHADFLLRMVQEKTNQ